MNVLAFTVLTGIGATLVMDLWGLIRARLFGIPAADYGMVGRWLGHMRNGRFRHEAIARSAAVKGEQLIGWSAHYLTGIAYATLLTIFWGTGWISHPSIGPALIVGIGTVAAPFLLMQPGMGAGIAASRTPRPNVARFQSLLNHTVFGLGLYLTAWVIRLLLPV
ncbi:hypothetical protein GCM10011348_04860 [Marinobacterium nitratireducens]|uniref:DUF2938 domain-containing protein n=1 Tax=Marinobacterium nitratireducens TaxID=518897 RepID=A0A917Z6U3_9GAMM|nr:DUF2938 domain-containing protein [Marinobacterium nitratireducens]GGO76797.1 hypothetical protein GCM10011348_04860 [Marinobacterium nitratireducens]